MALSRLSTSAFQAYRRVLAGLVVVGGPHGGRGGSKVDARTLFGRGERRGKSQSKVLSSAEVGLFELQIHRVRPDCTEDYVKQSGEHLVRISGSPDVPLQLLGGWTTLIGSACDEITHIWRYKSYGDISDTAEKLKNDKHWSEYSKARNKMITSPSSQIILPFNFWVPADPETMQPKGLYEMRSYTLTPGTLIEWGQWWEKGIQYRQDESVGGWFSQIGIMHQVHHLWAYKDLQDRSDTRQSAWQFPGWDECVLRTVPLIRHMETRILIPTSYSPLQ